MSPIPFYYEGVFYLFFSGHTATGEAYIFYAVSDSPYGPFEYKDGESTALKARLKLRSEVYPQSMAHCRTEVSVFASCSQAMLMRYCITYSLKPIPTLLLKYLERYEWS